MTRIVLTKVRCPKCSSANLNLVEVGTWTSEFRVINGRFDREQGEHMPESVDRLEAKCRDCSHGWKPRRAFSIDDAVTENADLTTAVPATEDKSHA